MIESYRVIFEDLLLYDILVRFKRSLSNFENKYLIAVILLRQVPVIVNELAIFLDNSGILSIDDFYKEDRQKLVTKLRQYTLKNKISQSKKVHEAKSEMGLNFYENIYDLNVIIDESNNLLYGFNFERYYRKEDHLATVFEDLIGLVRDILEGVLQSWEIDYEQVLSHPDLVNCISEAAMKFDKEHNLTRYSYSSSKLFDSEYKHDLTEQDFYFILKYYHLIKSTNIMPTGINVVLKCAATKFDTRNAVLRYVASTIEAFGSDLKQLGTTFGTEMQLVIDDSVSDCSFFSLNRKMRNNLHYSNIDLFSEEELDYIIENQKEYVSACLRTMDKYIVINIDKETLTMTKYLKKCQNLGMTHEDMRKNHNINYLHFSLTGEILIAD